MMNSIYRLGRYRRNRRNYSIHQRRTGKQNSDRLNEKIYSKIGSSLLMAYSAMDYSSSEEDNDRDIELDNEIDDIGAVATMFINNVHKIRKPRLITPDKIEKDDINFDSFTEQQYDYMIGFSKAETVQLFNLMAIPRYFNINEGRHQFQVAGIRAFLYFLARMHSPSARQVLDIPIWNYDHTTLGKMFNAVVSFIDENHSYRLNQLPVIINKFKLFNSKIKAKVRENLHHQEPLPPDAERCALFADGCRFRVDRPQGADWRQRAAFNAHKWYHCHGTQGIMAPDGIFYDWWDNPVGRFSDKHFMADSQVNALMQEIQMGRLVQYWIYGDKGYDWD